MAYDDMNRATSFKHPKPRILSLGGAASEDETALRVSLAKNPAVGRSLGHLGLAVRVRGPERFAPALLTLPYDPEAMVGVDARSVRVFRYEARSRSFAPVWSSGLAVNMGSIWARVRRPGLYVPIGLPRDRLLLEVIRRIAVDRRLGSDGSPEEIHEQTLVHLAAFMELEDDALQQLRALVARLELQTGYGGHAPTELELGPGDHVTGFALPWGATQDELRDRLERLEFGINGLPEEHLFEPPEPAGRGGPPWEVPPGSLPWKGGDWRSLIALGAFEVLDFQHYLPWLFSNDWWMYQHDVSHSGRASGWSNLFASTVAGLNNLPPVSVDGPVITKPSIVDGKVYVGSGRTSGASGGTLYKINLYTGAIEGRYPTLGDGNAFYSWQGVGGSPAVVGNRVYFTGVHGKVYCVDTSTMTPNAPHPAPIWVTDLKNPDPSHDQPVGKRPGNNPDADCWSGPLVVNGKVYVGVGEGEQSDTYGFIYCLDAVTGDVTWLFCTAKLSTTQNNQPNQIPASVAVSDPLPGWATSAGFSIVPDPEDSGCAVWSSCAYDAGLNRIYVGTGNSEYEGQGSTKLPDDYYGSGLISLDADTGAFKGFFQPRISDSYRPADADIDVPGSPTLFTRNGRRVLGFGSKNGSFFLLNPGCLGDWRFNVVIARQLAKVSPSVSPYADRLHMVHLGDKSNTIWHSCFDGETWSDNVPIRGQLSKAAPALAEHGGALHMIHLGDKSNRLWHSTFDGDKWSENETVPGQSSRISPALASYRERLHMVYVAEDSNRLCHTIFDGRQWSEPEEIEGQLSQTSPALAVYDGRLHMVHMGDTSHRIWHTSFDGSAWTENVPIAGQLSRAAPALATFTDFDGHERLHMAHLGDTSNRIWHAEFDGQKWTENLPVPGQRSRTPPALATYGHELHLVHLGDTTNRLWWAFFCGWATRRQLLPRANGDGTPANRGTAIATVVDYANAWNENEWGIYASPAVHPGTGRIFIGLGGRGSITDQDKTPFMRALDWTTLLDAWPTAVGGDSVSRYTTAAPPLYTSSEVGLASPAIINDLVFMSTNRAELYAFDVNSGSCLWCAGNLPSGAFALGPAISGSYVVVGAGDNVYRYHRPGPVVAWREFLVRDPGRFEPPGFRREPEPMPFPFEPGAPDRD